MPKLSIIHVSGPHLPRQAVEPHRLHIQPHRGLLPQRGHQLLPGNAAQEDAQVGSLSV